MTVEKLKSGSYRISKMVEGVRYRRIYDHIPKEKEFMRDIALEIAEQKEKPKIQAKTFLDGAKEYCDSKSNILSPKTVREYILLYKRLPEWFTGMDIYKIEQIDLNKLVNELSAELSAKTIKNVHGFISAVLRTFRPSMVIYTTLPKKAVNEPYIPSNEDVKKLIDHFKGTEYEIPFVLGCYGLRRSEILGVKGTDVEGNILHIHSAMVIDIDNNLVEKTTKTEDSTRDIYIPQHIADKIVEQGYAYNGNPGNISRAMKRAEEKLNIPPFSLHKCRHYFASELHQLGIPDEDIIKLTGHKTDEIMKKVYRHSMIEKEKSKKEIAIDKLSKKLFD